MNPEPPLLIIGKFPEDLDPVHFPWPEEAREKISFNNAKFADMELSEVIFDGMPFLLSRFTDAETGSRFAADAFDTLFCGLPSPRDSAIGVSPGNHLAGAAHLSEVNRRLLQLGKWIGKGLEASKAAWLPCRRLTSFSYFDETVGQYLADGPLPILLQTSFSKDPDGCFMTSGLKYFAGQEIRLTAPPDYGDTDVTRCLLRIIHDLATLGRIEGPARSTGLNPGEILIFSPGADMVEVEIAVEGDAPDAVPVRKSAGTRRR